MAVPYRDIAVWGYVGTKLAFVVDSGDFGFARKLIRSWIDELLQGRVREYPAFYPNLN